MSIQVPPDWVTFRDLDRFLQARFNVRLETCIYELVSTMKRGVILHRIGDIKERHTWRAPSLPAGLDSESFGRGGRRILVVSWDAAEADFGSGTVGGWKDDSGDRERCAIELLWSSVENWMRLMVRAFRRREDAVIGDSVPAQSVAQIAAVDEQTAGTQFQPMTDRVAAPVPEADGLKVRKAGGLDYSASDEGLINEILEGVRGGVFKNRWDGCLAVSEQGKASVEEDQRHETYSGLNTLSGTECMRRG
jgi:hypothetical protein